MTDLIVQPPSLLRGLFPSSVWRIPTEEKVVCLTFDDGPVPEQTPWVMETLDKAGIKATFFQVGNNVGLHRDIFEEQVRRGHEIGCHTQDHDQLFRELWGDAYSQSAYRGRQAAATACPRLFRPPHGQMTPLTAYRLTHRPDRLTGLPPFEKVVFWDVMPMDYDRRLAPQEVLQNVRRKVRRGSVVVFHDSIKAGERMRYALEGTIDHLLGQGYSFMTVSQALERCSRHTDNKI